MLQILKHFFLVIFLFSSFVTSVLGQQNKETELVRQVIDKNQQEFRAHVKDAFSQAAVLLSGQRRVVDHDKFSQLASSAERFLVEFRYEPIEQRPIVSEFSEQRQARWNLFMRFDEQAMIEALFDIGAPVWQMPRAPLKVWLIHESETGMRQLVTNQTVTPVEQQLKDQLTAYADIRGVSLVFPSSVQKGVSLSALWGLFEEDIRFANEITGDENALVIKLYSTASSSDSGANDSDDYGASSLLDQGGSEASDDAVISGRSWAFQSLGLFGNSSASFEGQHSSRRISLYSAIDSAVDQMSQQYGLQVNVNESSSSLVTITDIPDFDSYKRLKDQITSLLIVDAVLPKSAQHNDLEFEIHSRGNSHLLLTELVKINDLSQQISGAEILPIKNQAEVTLSAEFPEENSEQPRLPHYVFGYVVEGGSAQQASERESNPVPILSEQQQGRRNSVPSESVKAQAYPAAQNVQGRPVEKSISND